MYGSTAITTSASFVEILGCSGLCIVSSKGPGPCDEARVAFGNLMPLACEVMAALPLRSIRVPRLHSWRAKPREN